MSKVRILHVDDSVVIRNIIGRLLKSIDGVELLPAAANGKQGLETYKNLKPDLVILDIEMPIMDGMEALQEIINFDPKAKVIMCSTLTKDNADITIKAMGIGAIDYIPKPSNEGSEVTGSDAFKERLELLVNGFIDELSPADSKPTISALEPNKPSPKNYLHAIDFPLHKEPLASWKPKVIAVSSSTGGPQALFEFMSGMVSMKYPIVITQHMPPTFTTLLAKHITEKSGIPTEEAQDGMVAKAGHAIVAQGGKHMTFEKNASDELTVKLIDTPPENFCKPAADPMLRSLIDHYGGHILSVVLTGMGNDGEKGTQAVIDAGGFCVAQDKQTSVVWGMPGAVATKGLCSAVLPLNEIAAWVKRYAQ